MTARARTPAPPDEFWSVLQREVERLSPLGSDPHRAALRRLVESFARPGREGRYFSDRHAVAAYLRAFLPYELGKIAYPMDQFDWILPESLRTADCGSGPATATLGLMCWLAARRSHLPSLEVTLCEREGETAEVGARLVSELAALLGLSVRVETTGSFLPRRSVDLLLVQNSLSEAFSDPEVAARRLRAGGETDGMALWSAAVLVEPADRMRSRFLLACRDRLAESGIGVRAPCLRQTPCPALEVESDWCHMELSLEIPRAARMGLREASLPRHASKFSYLVLQQAPACRVDPALQRVVSALRRGKGTFECFLCGASGRLRTRLLKRHLGEGNRTFRRLRRGDVVRLTPVPESGKMWEVGTDAIVGVQSRPGSAPIDLTRLRAP